MTSKQHDLAMMAYMPCSKATTLSNTCEDFVIVYSSLLDPLAAPYHSINRHLTTKLKTSHFFDDKLIPSINMNNAGQPAGQQEDYLDKGMHLLQYSTTRHRQGLTLYSARPRCCREEIRPRYVCTSTARNCPTDANNLVYRQGRPNKATQHEREGDRQGPRHV
jgi:hypothetical protein